jgi:hypothetical protein
MEPEIKKADEVPWRADRVDAIPIAEALVCENCQCVVRSRRDCPICGSSSVMSLDKLLNREPGEAA